MSSMHAALDHPRGALPTRVGVDQQRDHHRRIVRRAPVPVSAVVGIERGQIHLLDRRDHEPREVILPAASHPRSAATRTPARDRTPRSSAPSTHRLNPTGRPPLLYATASMQSSSAPRLAATPGEPELVARLAVSGHAYARLEVTWGHRRTVGSPRRRPTTVARYSGGEHRRPIRRRSCGRGGRRSGTATPARVPGRAKTMLERVARDTPRRRSLRSLRGRVRRQDPPATDCGRFRPTRSRAAAPAAGLAESRIELGLLHPGDRGEQSVGHRGPAAAAIRSSRWLGGSRRSTRARRTSRSDRGS